MMELKQELFKRSGEKCELTQAKEGPFSIYVIPPHSEGKLENSVLVSDESLAQINSQELNPNYWRVLNDTMWSEHLPVQIMAYRLLKRLQRENGEAWAHDLLEQLYLDDEALEWANSIFNNAQSENSSTPTKDSNGNQLLDGDTVTLIKDLEVKGAGFTAKRGTLVKNISLTNNPLHIEGKINGTQIVLVAAFLKKVVG